MNDDLGFVAEFVVECHEHLNSLDHDLLRLERQPDSPEVLESIFRTLHTVKGAAGLIALSRLSKLAHAGESVMARIRKGALPFTPAVSDQLAAFVNVTRDLLDVIAEEGDDLSPEVKVEALIGQIDALLVTEEAPDKGVRSTAAALESPSATSEIVESSVRVQVDLLDELVTLVGELVVARNEMLQQGLRFDDLDLDRANHRINVVASDLQQAVMQTRMRSMGQIWSRMPVIVRDLARSLDREVEVIVRGSETELDRTLLEALRGPLTHLVRNSVDHGIEPPDERARIGKPPQGRLELSARHESGTVVIEITDDGRGIDPEAVGRNAVRQGLLTPDQLAALSAAETLDLIFEPGLSTAEVVTDLSGRGVGMDVVRTSIEAIGGSVEISSDLGLGTSIRVRTPLTLAIIPALHIVEESVSFLLPQANLVELVQFDSAQVNTAPGDLKRVRMVRVRDEALPLVFLAELLEIGDRYLPNDLTVIIVEAEGIRFGLAVDDAQDTLEVVVKPLGETLSGLPMYAGASVLGDGRVAMILDVAGLARLGGIRNVSLEPEAVEEVEEDGESILVVSVGEKHRAAVPLAAVRRLDTVPAKTVHHTSQHDVVTYRNQMLPLVHLAGVIGREPQSNGAEELSIVVLGEGDQQVGMVVEEIVDVVSTRLEPSDFGRRHGTTGTAVVDNHVLDLVDLDTIVQLGGRSN